MLPLTQASMSPCKFYLILFLSGRYLTQKLTLVYPDLFLWARVRTPTRWIGNMRAVAFDI